MKISSVFALPQYVQSFSSKEKRIFDSIFSLEEEKVKLAYDSQNAQAYLKQLFGKEKILSHRHTMSISNWVFSQQTLFSPIRVRRPITALGNRKLIAPSRKNCDFCNAKEKTPTDPFGRIETAYTITAANAGPYVGLHSLIIPKNIHHPLAITQAVFVDMLHVANEWIEKAHQYNPHAIFPSLIWNAGGRAGASIFHPHLHVFLTETPFEKQSRLYENMQSYQKKYKNPFFPTFIQLLEKLHLAKISDKITLAIALTPIKDKEFFIISQQSDIPLPYHFSIKTYSIISHFIHSLGVTNFNLSILFPPLGKTWNNFPTLARLVDRGNDAKPSDIAAMELFFASVVTTDPYTLLPFLA